MATLHFSFLCGCEAKTTGVPTDTIIQRGRQFRLARAIDDVYLYQEVDTGAEGARLLERFQQLRERKRALDFESDADVWLLTVLEGVAKAMSASEIAAAAPTPVDPDTIAAAAPTPSPRDSAFTGDAYALAERFEQLSEQDEAADLDDADNALHLILIAVANGHPAKEIFAMPECQPSNWDASLQRGPQAQPLPPEYAILAEIEAECVWKPSHLGWTTALGEMVIGLFRHGDQYRMSFGHNSGAPPELCATEHPAVEATLERMWRRARLDFENNRKEIDSE